MTCPDCEAKMSISKTAHFVKTTLRVEECSCGARFETETKVIRRLPATAKRLKTNSPQPQTTAFVQPATGKGVGVSGSGLSDPESGSVPDLIPSLPPDQGAEARAKPPKVEDPKHPRTAYGLLALFGRRWEAHEKKLWLKGRFDDRDAVELFEALGEIRNDDDWANAWEEVIAAVDTYLRIDSPFYAGHPFRKFVQELPALRTGDASGLDRLRKTKPEWDAAARKHQDASRRTRESEPTPIGAVVPKAWTAAEIAEAAELRKKATGGTP